MKSKTEYELKPMRTPNFIIGIKVKDGQKLNIHVSDISYNMLDTLCKRFRTDLFKKANVKDEG